MGKNKKNYQKNNSKGNPKKEKAGAIIAQVVKIVFLAISLVLVLTQSWSLVTVEADEPYKPIPLGASFLQKESDDMTPAGESFGGDWENVGIFELAKELREAKSEYKAYADIWKEASDLMAEGDVDEYPYINREGDVEEMGVAGVIGMYGYFTMAYIFCGILSYFLYAIPVILGLIFIVSAIELVVLILEKKKQHYKVYAEGGMLSFLWYYGFLIAVQAIVLNSLNMHLRMGANPTRLQMVFKNGISPLVWFLVLFVVNIVVVTVVQNVFGVTLVFSRKDMKEPKAGAKKK